MKSDTGMQHLPSVLNDNFDDFHADAVLLCERLPNEFLVKGDASDFNHFFNTGRVCMPDDNQPTS